MSVPSKVRVVEQSLFPHIQPDKPVGAILPSVFVGSNSDLMRAVAPFYLTGSVMDCTYGEGAWWQKFQPDPFTFHDKFKVDGVDFTALPEADDSVDTVCFDPPYVISGGQSVQMPDFQDRYGIGGHNLKMTNSAGGNASLHDLLQGGLQESIRVARQFVLVKCMEFSQGSGVRSSIGRDFHDIPFLMTKWALEAGCWKHDQIVHHTGSGPGGHNIFDPKRARRHHSYLLVFAKAKP